MFDALGPALDPSAGLSGAPLAGALAVLALLDSLSFGTLLIPVWLLLAPGRLRVGRMLVYLATILAFYAAAGVAIMVGASSAFGAFREALETPTAYVVQLVLGAGLFALSFALDSPRAKAQGAGRITRWRARAMGVEEPTGETLAPAAAQPSTSTATRGSIAALMGLALTAAAIELASMLPYLAGIGLITTSTPDWSVRLPLLAGYCAVMILPAIVLTVARAAATGLVAGPLARLEAWLSKSAASTTAWIVGIVGVLLALDALRTLGIVG